MIVADTDVLIDALNGKEPVKARVIEGLENGSLATTSISVFELLSGARGQRQDRAIRTLLEALPILELNREVADTAAEIRQELEATGQTIGLADYLIAGICVSRSAELLTRNRRHFRRVSRLRIAGL